MQTVKRHMLADVPVGAFLSGGVDSSAIIAAMKQVANAPVKAFTLGFPGTSIDESDSRPGSPPTSGSSTSSSRLEPAAAGDVLPQVQADFDEPCAATAAIPIWHLSRFARQQVKVVLCGEGADEVVRWVQETAYGPFGRKACALAERARRLIDRCTSDRALSLWNYKVQNARRFRQSARSTTISSATSPRRRSARPRSRTAVRDRPSGRHRRRCSTAAWRPKISGPRIDPCRLLHS